MKVLFTILLITCSSNAYGAVSDRFECTTKIHDTDNGFTNSSAAELNITRLGSSEGNSITLGRGNFSSEMATENWSVNLKPHLRYMHRVIDLDGRDIWQQSLCLVANAGHCKSTGEFSVCISGESTCFFDWADVNLDSNSGVPEFNDRLLQPIRGTVSDAGLPVIDYEVSCKYKGTSEL